MLQDSLFAQPCEIIKFIFNALTCSLQLYITSEVSLYMPNMPNLFLFDYSLTV